ncbi:hypothetical protein UlMin_042328 [Ulmus minor]
MLAVCPTNASFLFLPSSVPQRLFLPWKPRLPIYSFSTSSSNKIIYNQAQPNGAQVCDFSGVSATEDELLLEEWPQLLKLSIGSGNLHLGRAIHAFLVKFGCQNDTFVGNNLVNMYSKLNRLDDAHRVFDEMSVRNTITWTSLMKGYSESGDSESVFRIACEMVCAGERFNEHTCSVILQVCKSPEDRRFGEQVRGFAVKDGFEDNVFVGMALISMYSRSGCFVGAENVFNGMDNKDLQCLNYMILEYGKVGCGEKAVQVFIHLLSSGLEPNEYTYANTISACDEDIGVDEGKQLHGLSVKYGIVGESSVGNALITMYQKHGLIKEAEKMFSTLDERNLISWTSILTAYLKNGDTNKAFNVFLETLDLGIDCDSTFLSIMLDGFSEWRNIELGRQIHASVIKLGYLSDANIETALIDMYAKCRNLQSAKMAFNGLSGKTTASFNALIVGFSESYWENEEDPMVLLSQLRLAGLSPDFITFSRLLSLSADQASLVRGKSLHAYAIKTGFELDLTVSNAAITAYAKCGSIEEAYKMFNGMKRHDSISWNAIISAYALHGQSKRAISLFEEMKKEGFVPDEITILAILQACSYSGLWEVGICLFNELEPKYGIRPVIEHFACMVDLVGRAGHLTEAMDLINKSPFSNSPLLWRTLVNVSKLHGELSFGMLASKRLLDLEPEEAGSYILVSNMLAGGGMLDEAAKVRTAMKDLKMSKEAGCSWVEIDDKVHYFKASDINHPKSMEIYAKLDLLRSEMQKWQDENELHLLGDSIL